PEEMLEIRRRCESLGVKAAFSEVWAKGGEGGIELARLVLEAIPQCKGTFKPLYDLSASIPEKIHTIAKRIYGAAAVNYLPKAQEDLERIQKLGLQHLPICMAKTQKSLSDNPDLLGRPTGFTLTVREIEIASGAGFVIPITGDIIRMPGLPNVPAAEQIDINEQGEIIGLF
ncbi:MAG: formate--tetrahydrofolate ligase, partial [Bacteroidia bacterium]|nr:formate--tetrahydrofolate ligase [Bacteroidia bacterium]